MSRRKLSKADYKALNRDTPIGVRYPPGGGRAELRVPNKRQRRRRKRDNEGG
jgi:hypothetical protein